MIVARGATPTPTKPSPTSTGPVRVRNDPAATPPRSTTTRKPSPSATATSPPAQVEVPDVIGANGGYAETVMQTNGLVPELTYELSNSTCTVTAQNPKPTVHVVPGSTVHLVVDADANGLCTNEPLPP